MKVFVSSLIVGMTPVRDAAREAVTTLRHAPVMAEDFGSQPRSPQVACLSELRQSDVVLLILGEHYSASQPSGLSATHEEYREAQGRKDVIAFVQEGVTFEPAQAAFVQEVQGWVGGLFRGGFSDASDLKTKIIRALHDYELSTTVGPVDEPDLLRRSLALLPPEARNSVGSPMLSVALAAGPTQQILRPAEIEDKALWDALHKAAMFGETQVFDPEKGVTKGIDGERLVLQQERGGASIHLTEQGDLLFRTSLAKPARSGFGISVLLEEVVRHQLEASLKLAAWLLDEIDATQRLSRLAISVAIEAGDYMAWRTEAEHEASPNSVSIGFGGAEHSPIQVVKPRPSLRMDLGRTVDDLVVHLRRQRQR